MKKALIYLGTGLLSLISLFFAYAHLTIKFVAGIPDVAKETARNAIGNTNITFFEFLGDFSSTNPAPTFVTYITTFLVLIGVICAATLFVSGLMMLIRRDEADSISDNLMLKWLPLVAFVTVGIALVLGLLFPNLPEVPTQLAPLVSGFGTTIGFGAIMFLVVSAVGTALSLVFDRK